MYDLSPRERIGKVSATVVGGDPEVRFHLLLGVNRVVCPCSYPRVHGKTQIYYPDWQLVTRETPARPRGPVLQGQLALALPTRFGAGGGGVLSFRAPPWFPQHLPLTVLVRTRQRMVGRREMTHLLSLVSASACAQDVGAELKKKTNPDTR